MYKQPSDSGLKRRTPPSGAYNPTSVNLYFDLLPGSRRYLSYEGTLCPDGGTEATYMRTCPGQSPGTVTTSVMPFWMTDGRDGVNPDGTLQGTATVNEDEMITTYEWDLRPLIP